MQLMLSEFLFSKICGKNPKQIAQNLDKDLINNLPGLEQVQFILK